MAFATDAERDDFIKKLTPSIINSYNSCIVEGNKQGVTPQEPDFIAFLGNDLTKNIQILLKNYSHIVKCETKGVFCHQSPKVKFTNPNPKQKNCAELGDLLIVYTEKQNHTTKSRALLLQAKCVSSTPHIIGSDEQHQLYLYQYWPEFEYSSPKKLIESIELFKKNNKQNIKPHRHVDIKQNPEGSVYLLLSKPPSQAITYKYATSIPNNLLKCKFELATAIGRMLHFDSDSGSDFELIPNYDPSKDYIQNDDWSNMINDILYIGNNHFNRRRIGLEDKKRIFCFECNEFGQFSGDDIILSANRDGKHDDMTDDGEFSGIFTLMINAVIDQTIPPYEQRRY